MPSWPSGVLTGTVIFGAGFTPFGNPTSSKLVVTPIFTGTKTVVWAATSTPMLAFAETATSGEGASGTAQLPFVDQDGWLDDGQHPFKLWGYRLDETNTYGTSKGPTRTKYLQLLTGQSTVYFDDIPDGSLGLPAAGPVATVTSVNGQVGAVTVAGASDADVAALIENPASATATALAAELATKVPAWQASTAYPAGTVVLSPAGYLVQALATFTSGASFNAANWTQLSIDPASVAATYSTLPKNTRNGLTGWWHVDGYGAKGDNTTDDAASIQAAIDACSAAGGGRVYLPRLSYVIGSSLVPKSGVTVVSDGGQIRASASIPGFNATTTSFTDFVLDGLVFVGTVNQFPTAPQRGRTTSGAGMTTAVQMSGDLDANNPGNAALTNFTMRNCAVRNCSSLPILIRGLRGVVRVASNEFTNNMDAGFTFNQEVIFTGNHVQMSADNGVSVSRGNTKVTVTGNTFENCCYWGIWVSGFNTNPGSTNFTVTGNTIKNVGFGGIQADAAAMYGAIVGNAIDCGYNRGPSDQPTDSWGCGIYVGGLPTGSSTPTTLAKNVLVGHNQIRTAPRAGIILNGTQSVKVSGNLIADFGSQFLADGATAILASDTNNNVGILVLNSTTSLNLTIDTNTMIDERSTAYGNWSIIPIIAPTTSNYWGNTHQGLRNTYNLQEQTATGAGSRTFRDVISFSSNTKHVGGATAGSNAGGGIANGFDVNGAAGIVRPFRMMTAGSERWRLYGDTTAEGGANAGTNLVLESHDDSGTLLATFLTALRVGSMTFGVQAQPLTIKSRLVSGAAAATIGTGAAASASSAGGNGANDTAGTVNATALASPTNGALVTVTFATAYSAVPHVTVTPQNSASSACQPYVGSRSATGFTIFAGTSPTASAALQYDYHVIG